MFFLHMETPDNVGGLCFACCWSRTFSACWRLDWTWRHGKEWGGEAFGWSPPHGMEFRTRKKNNMKFLSVCYEHLHSTWIVEFWCCTSSGYRIHWSEKTKDIIIPTKLGPLTPQILEAFVGYQPQSSASHRSAGTACLRKKHKGCLTRARLALLVNKTRW